MNTIPQAIECPQCQAPLSLAAGRRHCQCAYCGSKFVVDGSGGESPHLTRFESIVATALDGAVAQDAYQRLADVEIAIADAEDEVELKRAELAQAKSAYLETRAQVQKAIAPAQNPTYVAGLLALLAWFLVLFALRGTERLAGLAIAVLLVLVAWAFHREWQQAEGRAQGEMREAREAIQEAEASVNEALARVEDHTLERELCQRQVLAGGEKQPGL